MELYEIQKLKANIFSKKLKRVECSNDKKTWIFLSVDNALEYPWIKLNSMACSSVVVVDIDPQQYEENTIKKAVNFAPPNYIIYNPFKDKSLQLGYILNKQIFSNSKAFKIFEEVKNELYRLFNSDLNNKNYKAKNPFCSWWDVQWMKLESYDLYELKSLVCDRNLQIKIAENFELVEKRKNEHYVYSKESSNCNNFDDLRLKAYEWVDTFRDTLEGKELATALFNFLLNQANPKIYKHQKPSEIKATIKSIVKFCINTYKSKNNGKYTRINHIKKENEMRAKDYIKEHYDVHKKFSLKQREEIAEKLNLTPKTVSSYLADLRKTVARKSKTKVEMIVEYKEEKLLSFLEISKLLEMKEDAVKKAYQRFKKANLKG